MRVKALGSFRWRRFEAPQSLLGRFPHSCPRLTGLPADTAPKRMVVQGATVQTKAGAWPPRVFLFQAGTSLGAWRGSGALGRPWFL